MPNKSDQGVAFGVDAVHDFGEDIEVSRYAEKRDGGPTAGNFRQKPF